MAGPRRRRLPRSWHSRLGRQVLFESVDWTRDGQPVARAAVDEATAPHRLIDAEALERAGFGVQILDPVGLAEGALGVDDAGGPALLLDDPATTFWSSTARARWKDP